ncbi:MAG TPA: hypothetical protein VH643_39915 [Gemmataceae bacterium]
MTEAEWLACTDPKLMLDYLRFKCGVRKLRLFTAACLRRDLHWSDIHIRIAIKSVERLADDRERIAAGGLRAARMDASAARAAAQDAARSLQPFGAAQAALLRDICGPLPFRPTTLDSAWLSWHGGLLASIAWQMYDSRDFADMPVLADALEEAGCQNQDILSHCRSGGDHVRGCWVIDALLGKS